ncbi:YugN family protein [Numidum massiliense]|uniref:YugN family protein n=1 Tax=Numidum massiliense TaxID=1522315 RepID=UPI0006D56264|nr:YugN family protein [Numidum massiliense]
MELANSHVENIQATFGTLKPITMKLGFYPSWDYHKVCFDLKLEDNGTDPEFYLRIPAKVVEGSMENPKCVLELMTPVFALHYYPHGLDYEAEVPDYLRKKAEKTVKKLVDTLKKQSA